MKKMELIISGETVCGSWNEKAYSSRFADKTRIYINNKEYHIEKSVLVEYLNNEKIAQIEKEYNIVKDDLHEKVLNSTDENHKELEAESRDKVKEQNENRLIKFYEKEDRIHVTYYVIDTSFDSGFPTRYTQKDFTLFKKSTKTELNAFGFEKRIDDRHEFDAFRKYNI